jgi:hypothetical protein
MERTAAPPVFASRDDEILTHDKESGVAADRPRPPNETPLEQDAFKKFAAARPLRAASRRLTSEREHARPGRVQSVQ